MKRWLTSVAVLALLPTVALAQGPVQYRSPDNINNIPVSAATPLPVVSTGASAGGSPGTGTLSYGQVVTGDQAYTSGTTQPLNLTATGRLKVGISSAGNIDPALQLSTQTASDLVSCKYRATPPTWSDGWTGAMRCDSSGALSVSIVGGLVPSQTADAGNPVKIGGVYTGATGTTLTAGQRGDAQMTSSGDLRVSLTTAGGGVVYGVPLTISQGSTGSTTSAVGIPMVTGAISTAPTVTTASSGTVAKAAAANVYSYGCSVASGGTAGWCVLVNATTVPSSGTTPTYCDLPRAVGVGATIEFRSDMPKRCTTGAVVAVSSTFPVFTPVAAQALSYEVP